MVATSQVLLLLHPPKRLRLIFLHFRHMNTENFSRLDCRYPDFPIEILPQQIQTEIQAYAKANRLDLSWTAACFFSSVSAAIGNTYYYNIPNTDLTAISSLYLIGVAEQGVGKTGALKSFSAPFYQYDKQFISDNEAARQRWEEENSNLAKGQKPTQKDFYDVAYAYKSGNLTIETLAGIMTQHRRGAFIATDEMWGFFSGQNQYKKGGGNDAETILEMFSGGSTVINRTTKGATMIDNVCVNIVGGLQPYLISKLKDRGSDNGELARFLFVVFEQQEGRIGECSASVNFCVSIISQLLNEQHESNVKLELTNDAFKLYQEYDYENLISQLRGKTKESVVAKYAFPKLRIYAPRFALILHKIYTCFQKDSITIDADIMQKAITLTRYFEKTAYLVWSNDFEAAPAPVLNTLKKLEVEFSGKEFKDIYVKITGCSQAMAAKILNMYVNKLYDKEGKTNTAKYVKII